MKTTMAKKAIEQSIERGTAVTVEDAPGLIDGLLAECVDGIDRGAVREFWGPGWRVHVRLSTERYFVVPAPGHYGDTTRVLSAHYSLAEARRAAGRGYVVRRGDKEIGARFTRAAEEIYPIA